MNFCRFVSIFLSFGSLFATPAEAIGGRFRNNNYSNQNHRAEPSRPVPARPAESVVPRAEAQAVSPKLAIDAEPVSLSVDTSYRSKVKWDVDQFTYQTPDGKWQYAAEALIAKDSGMKPQGKNAKLEYGEGDILFRVGDGWYKADGKEHPKPALPSDDYSDLPPKIRHFIDVYKRIRPDMKFDRRIHAVAERRARIPGVQHVSNINRLIWDAGFPTPDVNNGQNSAESLWGGANAEQALAGWAGHKEHAVHVFATTKYPNDSTAKFFSAHKYYGVGYNPGNNQWVLLTSRPPQ
jgi:hypothetical protein